MDQEKIVEMLSRGYAQHVVAAAVGCTDSYISQLLSDEVIRDQIATSRLQYLEKHVEVDDSMDSLEEKSLRTLHKLLPFITDPMKALRVFQVANAAKRKTVAPEATSNSKGTVVNINLPSVAAVQFRLSPDRQVVEVNGRSTATLPSNVLTRKLAERKETLQVTDQSSAAALLASVSNGLQPLPVRNLMEEL